jgi:hypothetical protein
MVIRHWSARQGYLTKVYLSSFNFRFAAAFETTKQEILRRAERRLMVFGDAPYFFEPAIKPLLKLAFTVLLYRKPAAFFRSRVRKCPDGHKTGDGFFGDADIS